MRNDLTFDHAVAVIGAGPTGLLVAAELALAGVDVVVLDRQPEVDTTIKAGSVNVATAEILDRRGLRPAAEAAQQRFVAELSAAAAAAGRSIPPIAAGKAASANGTPARPTFPAAGHFAGMFFRPDLVDQDDPVVSAHAGAGGSVLLRQAETETLLADHARALGVEVVRGVGITDLQPLREAGADADGADAADAGDGTDVGVLVTTDRGPLRVGWVVGADGGRSTVRRLAGIDFVGTDPEITGYQAIADLEGVEGLRPGWTHTPTGVYSLGPVPGRVLTVQFTGAPDRALRDEPVTAEELQASLRLVSGRDVVVRGLRGRATRWTDNARQASTYRSGRVLLAGDAAHVHSPFSGQGLNLGAGDAVNLGWKLAATVQGWAPDGLLDTYTSERHPIGAAVLDWTRAQVALMRGDDKTVQLRRVVQDELLGTVPTMTRVVLTTAGLGQHVAVGEPGTAQHPLAGQLVGDTPLDDGSRLADHFHGGGFVLLDRTGGQLVASAADWSDRLSTVVESVTAEDCPAAYRELTGLLVRPDGVVAWASESPDAEVDGLTAALRRWAGDPRGSR